MYTVLSFLAYAALACVVVALWKPRIYPFKNPGRLKAAGFYFVAFLVFFLFSSLAGPGDSERGTLSPGSLSENGKAGSGEVMTWTLLSREIVAMPKTGRDRLRVTICPTGAQASASREALTSLATEAAVQFHKESGVPVVILNVICQQADNALAEAQLAQVVYIPDGKGFDGVSDAAPTWETLRVAKRGFSDMELKYLQLWAQKYRQYQSHSGVRTKELDADISAELGAAPGSLQPFANILEAVEAPQAKTPQADVSPTEEPAREPVEKLTREPAKEPVEEPEEDSEEEPTEA